MIRQGDAGAVTTSIDTEPTVLYGMKPAAEPARYTPATATPDATVLVTQQVLPAEGREDIDTRLQEQLVPGMTVKGRFILEEVLGVGGMGVVFRARDLRKEEAQDCTPHIAIKVLGRDFKQHPCDGNAPARYNVQLGIGMGKER